ncbi:MAG: hypothetical protein ACRD5L_08945, partial [Bryobacteraceae bacterium]
AGLCLLIGRRTAFRWSASGALLAAAAWCTPSVALVGGVAVLWFAISRERRAAIVPFLGGVAAVSIAAVGALAATGSLAAFFRQMAWLRHNYSTVNILPYGAVIGGYRSLFAGSGGAAEFLVRVLVVMCLALPAILPPAAILGGWAWWRRTASVEQRETLQLLLFATIVLVITAFPRADMMHLAFVAALPYALTGAAMARLLPGRAKAAVAMASMLMASIFAANYFLGWRETARVQSPAGVLRVPLNQVADVEKLMATVHPGEGLFVYPYMPLQYFLTQTRNPTRFGYLAPGMMTRTEEMETLAELQTQPPKWLLYLQLSPQEFLRVFPNGSGLNWRFDTLEDWLRKHYQPVENPGVNVAGYRLWRRNAQP